jgi:hypothetical protein
VERAPVDRDELPIRFPAVRRRVRAGLESRGAAVSRVSEGMAQAWARRRCARARPAAGLPPKVPSLTGGS